MNPVEHQLLAYLGLAIMLFGIVRCLWLIARDRRTRVRRVPAPLETLDLQAAAARRRRRRAA